MTEPFLSEFHSVKKKIIMAVSGVIVFGFVAMHIVGNLRLFAGPEALNGYAAFLQGLGPVKWVIRGVLLGAVLAHMVSAISLTRQNWKARPRRYAVVRYRETTYAARTMWIGGPLILLFVVYHLLHLTTGHLHVFSEGFVRDPGLPMNVFNNVVYAFQEPLTAGVYIVAMLLVGLHLYHGIWSMLQTMGLSHSLWNALRKPLALSISLLVTVAGVSLPVSVMLGLVTPAL